MAEDIFETNAVVVGAGAVGLACAAELTRRGVIPVVVEKHSQIGSETSSRNSEVIHAGIYYPPESHKADHCMRGKKMLFQYLEAKQINYNKCGKLIVATHEDEVFTLHNLRENALQCGLMDLEFKSKIETKRMEPELSAISSLYSPNTAIFDSHAFMGALAAEISDGGGDVALNSRVSDLRYEHGHFWVKFYEHPDLVLKTPFLVNAAGFGAIEVAGKADFLSDHLIPTQVFAKGCYLSYTGKNPFKHLIYPAPVPGALGIHVTFDLQNQLRFGPNIQFSSKYDVDLNSDFIEEFYQAVRAYWPNLDSSKLTPSFCGVRPKIKFGEQLYKDFAIMTDREHSVKGLVNLFGIESPGLTSSLSIAQSVIDRLLR